MTGQIYYFSGTGNSLAVARGLAEQLEAKLTSIPRLMDRETITAEAEVVGLVFPIYHGGLPLIVKRFIDRLSSLQEKYLFAVCTYGDSPGLALEYTRDQLASRGGKLSAGFGVHLPYNYITPSSNLKDFFGSFTLREIDMGVQQVLTSEARTKVHFIAEYVHARRSGRLDRDAVFITRLVDAINLHESLGKTTWLKIAGIHEPTRLPFIESRQLMDRAFNVDESCKGCGTCVKVCPVNNMELVDGRPVWHQRCEQCFACLQWCPQQAIQFGRNTSGRSRYHHPQISLENMLIKASPEMDQYERS